MLIPSIERSEILSAKTDGELRRKVYYRNGSMIEGDVLEKYIEKLKQAKAEQKTKP